MSRSEKTTYSTLSESEKFREQSRLAFAGVVVATAYVIPNVDALTSFLHLVVGLAAVLSSIYLILSAARIKYTNTNHIYQALYSSEIVRRKMFDWSIDIFGFAFLWLVSLLAVELIEKLIRIKFNNTSTWIAVIVTFATFLVFLTIASSKIRAYEQKAKLPKI